jgi:hypothetical protein
MEVVTVDEDGKERLVGYNCVHRYGKYEVKLACDIVIGTLVLNKNYSEKEEKELNKWLGFANEYIRVDMGYTLGEQIKYILKYFDRHFSG